MISSCKSLLSAGYKKQYYVVFPGTHLYLPDIQLTECINITVVQWQLDLRHHLSPPVTKVGLQITKPPQSKDPGAAAGDDI